MIRGTWSSLFNPSLHTIIDCKFLCLPSDIDAIEQQQDGGPEDDVVRRDSVGDRQGQVILRDLQVETVRNHDTTGLG